MAENGRRIVRVPVTIQFLIEMMIEGWSSDPYFISCSKGLPAGAKLVGVTHDPMSDCVYFFFEHEDFELIPYAEIAPTFYPEFRRDMPVEKVAEEA